MPQSIKDGVVAAENRTFWTDQGIDPRGILRAAFNNASGNDTQGASTITQQYVKILYLTQDQTLTRKVKEAIISLKLQRDVSKQEILEGYLNTIYFGRGAYGVQAAAKAYFDRGGQGPRPPAERGPRQRPQRPQRPRPRPGQARQARAPRPLPGGPGCDGRGGDDLGRGGRQGLPQAARVPGDRAGEPVRRPARPRADHGARRAGPARLRRGRDRGWRAQGHDHVHAEGDDRRRRRASPRCDPPACPRRSRARRAAPSPAPATRTSTSASPASSPAPARCAASSAARTTSTPSSTGRSRAARPGSTMKPAALVAAIEDGFSLKDTFEGNSPFVLPDGTDFENQGDADYGSAVSMVQATEDSINTAFIDMTDVDGRTVRRRSSTPPSGSASRRRRPARRPRASPTPRRASSRRPASRSAARP